MPSIDDFIRPREWISDFVSDVGRVLREWGKDRYIPIRQQVDEDWRDHKLVEPLLKELLVDLGINAAFFPAEVGGTDMPDPCQSVNSARACSRAARGSMAGPAEKLYTRMGLIVSASLRGLPPRLLRGTQR